MNDPIAGDSLRVQLSPATRARARTLLTDLNRVLEDDDCPLVRVLQKSIRIAEMMGEHEYKMVFQTHLDGIPLPGQKLALDPLVQKWPDKGMKERFNFFDAVVQDRRVNDSQDGQISNLSIDELERKAKLLEKTASEVGPTSPAYTQAVDGALLFRRILNRILLRVGVLARVVAKHLDREDSIATPPTLKTIAEGGRIFIGHGRSDVWRDLARFLEDDLHLPWNEFNHDTSAGKSTKEVLEHAAENACFALLVMTGEDQHSDGLHARENVIHETGLFQGRLGFDRAIVLLEEGCHEFSNIQGTGQIRFPKANIMAKRDEIRKVLAREAILARDRTSKVVA